MARRPPCRSVRTTRRPTVSATTWGRACRWGPRGSRTATATSTSGRRRTLPRATRASTTGAWRTCRTTTSCCPGDDAAYDSATRSYINGGTCLAKSTKAKHEANAAKLKRMHTCGPTATAKLDATESCPSRFSMSYDGGLCAMHKSVRECEVASPPASCATDHAVAHLPGDDDAGVHVPRRHAPSGEWWLLCRGHQRPRQLRRAQRDRNARRRHDVGEGHLLQAR